MMDKHFHMNFIRI